MPNSHLKKLQDLLVRNGLDAVLITSKLNQRYLSGFDYDDGYIVVTQKHAWLITDFRYTEAAMQAMEGSSFEVQVPQTGMMKAIYEDIWDDGGRMVAIEESAMTVAFLERIKIMMPELHFQSGASALLDQLRIHKDEDELRAMQEAQDLADQAFTHILSFIRPSMTEMDVALELEFYMRSHGAEAEAFQTIAVSGSASSRPHGVPRYQPLEKGFLTMDFGARVRGYNSDMTRTIVIGQADADMKKLYTTVLSAQTAALEYLREGVSLQQVDAVARNLIEKAGYHNCFGHGLGHGVGLFIHELPHVSPAADPKVTLERGHVITIEPGIYIPGRYGCRIEDMVALKADGTILDFAHSPKNLIELE